MNVLVACEYSGRVRNAFTNLGHNAMSCDLLPTDSPGKHYQGDMFDLDFSKFDLMVAHPPCTRLANSGVRWLHERDLWTELNEAAEFYKKIQQIPIAMKCIENPIMHKYAKALLGDVKRQVVQPWWFGEKTFKATGYELYGLPDLKPSNKLVAPKVGTEEHKKWSWIHRASPGPDRWKLRSTTPQGIAKAMAEQWGGYVKTEVAA
jgi:hypothetical protein